MNINDPRLNEKQVYAVLHNIEFTLVTGEGPNAGGGDIAVLIKENIIAVLGHCDQHGRVGPKGLRPCCTTLRLIQWISYL